MNPDPTSDESTPQVPLPSVEAAAALPDWTRHGQACADAAERVAELEAQVGEARRALDALRKARELAPGRFARVYVNGGFQMARVTAIAPADNSTGITIAVLATIRSGADSREETVHLDATSLG